jgi:hypothetical protein
LCLFCAVTVGMARWAAYLPMVRIGVGDGSQVFTVVLLVDVQHAHSVDSHPVCWEYRRATEGWHARAAAVRGMLWVLCRKCTPTSMMLYGRSNTSVQTDSRRACLWVHATAPRYTHPKYEPCPQFGLLPPASYLRFAGKGHLRSRKLGARSPRPSGDATERGPRSRSGV